MKLERARPPLVSIRISYYHPPIDHMSTVRVSSKFQVVIPQSVRERMGLTAGQPLEVIAHDHRIELVPVRPMPQMRGFLRGIDTDVAREEDRAL